MSAESASASVSASASSATSASSASSGWADGLSKGELVQRRRAAGGGGKRLDLSGIPLRDLYPAAQFDDDSVLPSQVEKGGVPDSITGDQGKLSKWTKFIFALPGFGWYGAHYYKLMNMAIFYTDDYPRAQLGALAFFKVLAVLIDAFTDPTMARLTDGCKSKYGRRKPFLMIAALMIPGVLTISFMPPGFWSGDFSEEAADTFLNSFWFGMCHIGWKLCDTCLLIPLQSFGNELTPNYKARTNLWLWWMGIFSCGILFGLVVPNMFSYGPKCKAEPDNGCVALPFNALAFTLAFVTVPLLVLIKTLPERRYEYCENFVNSAPIAGATKVEYPSDGIVPSFISTSMNQPFRYYIGGAAVQMLGFNVPFALVPFVAKWVVSETDYSAEFIVLVVGGLRLFAQVLGVPIWGYISGWPGWGKYRTFVVGIFLSALTQIALVVVDYRFPLLPMVGMVVLWGIAYSGGSVFSYDIVNELIDYDVFLMGKRREAQYTYIKDFIPKFMELPGEALPFMILNYYKYDPDLNKVTECDADGVSNCEEFVKNCPDGKCQPDGVLWTLRICFSVVPGVTLLIMNYFLLKGMYMRDAWQHDKIAEGIVAHSVGQDAVDPLYGHTVPAPPLIQDAPSLKALRRPIGDDLASEPSGKSDSKVAPDVGDDNNNAGDSVIYESRLHYFWPGELNSIQPEDDGDVAYGKFVSYPLRTLILGLLMAGGGCYVIYADFDKLNDKDKGPGLSVLGLMLAGIGLVISVFSYQRFRAGMSLKAEFRSASAADEDDFKKQMALMKKWYAGFTGGDRSQRSIRREIRDFWKVTPARGE